jgi:hypothetical protein
MRSTKRSWLAHLLSTGLLVACGSDKESNAPPAGDGDAGAPVTPTAACEHEFDVRFARCVKDAVAPATLSSARTRYVASCVSALGLTGATRAADEVEACAKAVEAEACGVFPDFLPGCAQKPGTLGEGATCNVGAQCQSGVCDLGGAVGKPKGCGVCSIPPAEGERCDAERPLCAFGMGCVGTSAQSTTCKRVRYVDANATCNGVDLQCRPDAVCAQVQGSPSATCLPRAAAGQPCSEDAFCNEETFCKSDTAKCTSRGKAGDACDSVTPCLKGFGCDKTTNKCAPLTFAAPGESCGGSVACLEGVCGQGTGAPTCPPVVEDGKGCLERAHMTCRAPAACVNDACVMPTTATCQ